MENKIKLIPLVLVSAVLVACGSGGSSVNGNPIDVVTPPGEIVTPIDKETKIKATPDSPAEIMQSESFNFSVTRDSGSADSIVVMANFVSGAYSGDWVIISEPSPCNLSLAGTTSCHFSAFSSSQLRFDASLAKVLPLSYAVVNNSSYEIKVTARTSNNVQVESSPVLDFTLYTPVTNLGAVVDQRFTVGEGVESECITDNLTGLMWPKNGRLFNPRNLDDALSLVDNMNKISGAIAYGLCGHKDWHLSTVNELASLLNHGEKDPVSWLNDPKQGFINVQGSYKSSTSYVSRSDYVWYVYLYNGDIKPFNKNNDRSVWPVRRIK
ncbi:MAG: DUF1566 domain-containing protein [Burkholderiales bacterium]|nr:DUF1566 domain-containing protein [Burkholderiales bacterium]